MNQLTFILAILVFKDVLSVNEAKSIKKAASQGTFTANLSEMISKVSDAVTKDEHEASNLNKINAKDLLK
jgi:hypothetical protein